MKKLVLTGAGILLAMVILLAGCTAKQPSAAASTHNVTGAITFLSVPLNGGNTTMTIQTSQGEQTIPIADNTTFELNGKACSIDDLYKLVASGNTTYQCAAVMNDCIPIPTAAYITVITTH